MEHSVSDVVELSERDVARQINHDPDAVGLGPREAIRIVETASDTDLDHPPGIDQPLLDGPAERCPVTVGLPELLVGSVEVCVEVNQADRPVSRNGSKER